MDRNRYFSIGSVFNFSIKIERSRMDKFRVFVYMLIWDASLKQSIFPCIIHISIFGAFSVKKKCTLYMGKYGNTIVFMWEETLSAHNAHPKKIHRWRVLVCENISENNRAYR